MNSQKERQRAVSVPGRSVGRSAVWVARHDVINGFTVSRIITVVQPPAVFMFVGPKELPEMYEELS